MPKIIRVPLYEQVHCRYCGTVYEYVMGDKIAVACNEDSDTLDYKHLKIVKKLMQCPTCGLHNELARKKP